MKKFASFFIKKYGINNYIAVKNKYNESVGQNRFYKMISERLGLTGIVPKQLAADANFLASFLNNELLIHFKEFSQYQ